ncbi:condensation domain-containing protein [Paraburkholderia humisilvae]|uniref:Linear gramicidin synthase subunit D n=1 Tax=Paraburkholderia humisilvae TaxID=627669 RepID=A0A6J5EYY2_9BURK|nr:condensation domain-containing protein [Paraburkholderia humisilvae]CAB3771809.1 Linear gramicidin synthase subunit D [Paraburkholderia humisilvae]
MTVIGIERHAGAQSQAGGAAATALAPLACTPAGDLVSVTRLYAVQRPHAVAVRFLADGETAALHLTYAELDARARRLAAVLRQHGGACERVLLLLPSGLDYIVAFFACQYAGMIAVPAYPPQAQSSAHAERLSRIAQDCGACAAVLDDASRAWADAIAFDAGTQRIAQVSPSAGVAHDADEGEGFCIGAAPGDAIAFLQYTSGSTSAPKGVMVSHANLCENIDAMARSMDCRVDGRMFSWLPLYHDMGLINGVLMPVLCGFPLTLMAPLHFLERPARWLAGVARERATITGGPDFAFRLCAERVRDAQLEGLDLASLRVAFCGSEPIRQRTFEQFAARFAAHGFDSGALYPCYGLAEATLFVTGVTIGAGAPERSFSASALAASMPLALPPAGDADAKQVVGCGVPAARHSLAIVDPHTGARLADGRVGEVWCSGPSIAQGYWHNRQATSAAFVDDVPGFAGRWLRTGDLGFIDGGGLFICGRHKDMIVLRGENVYPQDLEALLADRIEWLRRGRIAAFPVEAGDGAEAIGIAAEVPRGRARQIAPGEIVAAIAAALGEAFRYEVDLVLLLEPGDLPRTSSGKLQRSACFDAWRSGALVPFAVRDAHAPEAREAQPTFDANVPAMSYTGAARGAPQTQCALEESPHTPTSRIIAEIWRDMLDVPLPAPSEDFFTLGGRSLLAVKVAWRLRAALAIDVPLGLLFSHPTPALLGAALDTRQAEPLSARRSVLAPVRRAAADAPLSLPQERLWVLWRLEPDSPAYNLAAALSLEGSLGGALDTQAVHAALDMLVGRHEMLRTRFVEIDDEPRQVIVPLTQAKDAWHWDCIDAQHLSPAECDVQLHRLARAPFDLTHGPLMRATLVTLGLERHLLHLVMHHIVADGWSFDVLLREFAAGYRAARRGETPALLPLPIQYADYAAWQRERLAADGRAALDAQLAWWRARLAGYDMPLDLPALRDRNSPFEPHAGRVCVPISAALAGRLDALARAGQATLFMVLLAAFDAVLYRYSGAQDIVVAVPVAGRDRPETEGLIGFFVNTLAMRASVKGAQPFAALLRAVRDDSIDAQGNADVPFDRVVAALRTVRRDAASSAGSTPLGGTPLAQIKFVMHDALDVERELDGVRATLTNADASDARFELALDVSRNRLGGLDCVFAYAAALYDEGFIAQLARHYVELIAEAAATPQRAIGQFTLSEARDDDACKSETRNSDTAARDTPRAAGACAA